jgi:hypothetical protein
MVIASPDGGSAPAVGSQADEVAERLVQVNEQSKQIQSSATGFAAAAGSGFHIEPEAAATLIKACQDALHELNTVGRHLDTISQAPQLGRTPGASVVAPFTQNVATDDQGIRPAIDNLKQTLNDMIQGYQKASTNYQQTEAIIAESVRAKQGSLPRTSAPPQQRGGNRAV